MHVEQCGHLLRCSAFFPSVYEIVEIKCEHILLTQNYQCTTVAISTNNPHDGSTDICFLCATPRLSSVDLSLLSYFFACVHQLELTIFWSDTTDIGIGIILHFPCTLIQSPSKLETSYRVLRSCK